MDIDVNRPKTPTKIYEMAGVRFRGLSPNQMLADKLSAVSSDRVFRRIKDVVDIYYISKAFDFDIIEVRKALEGSGRTLGNFQGFIHRSGDLKHAYEKFRFSGDVNKPSFEDVYRAVKVYIKDVLPKEKHRSYAR